MAHHHPPCTPSASCQPVRCHPSLPPCQNPDRCLRTSIEKGVKPCQSAISIMATRTRRCGTCGMFNGKNVRDPRRQATIIKYLRRKAKERRLAKRDMLEGTNRLELYRRRKGTRRASIDCCAGHGHRGRLKRGRPRRPRGQPPGARRGCTIL